MGLALQITMKTSIHAHLTDICWPAAYVSASWPRAEHSGVINTEIKALSALSIQKSRPCHLSLLLQCTVPSIVPSVDLVSHYEVGFSEDIWMKYKNLRKKCLQIARNWYHQIPALISLCPYQRKTSITALALWGYINRGCMRLYKQRLGDLIIRLCY